MNVSLTPRLEEMIRERVDSGLYNNASEVVREALRLLDQRDGQRRRFLEEIQIGLDQVERGETIPWTPELMETLIRESEANAAAGKPIDDAVRP